MTDRDAAVWFAVALEAALDEWGHLGWCIGVADDDCDEAACRMVRQVVQTARELGYLPTPAEEAP